MSIELNINKIADTELTIQKDDINISKSGDSITLSNESNSIDLSSTSTVVEIETQTSSMDFSIDSNEIVISPVGVQGIQGESGSDTGSTSWIDVAGDVEYTGVDTNITGGEVSECDYKGSTIYRFINSTENANGYSIEDSFYSNFDGTNLSNLIVSRNMSSVTTMVNEGGIG